MTKLDDNNKHNSPMKNLNDDFKEISELLIKASKHPKMIFTAMCVFVFVCCFFVAHAVGISIFK